MSLKIRKPILLLLLFSVFAVPIFAQQNPFLTTTNTEKENELSRDTRAATSLFFDSPLMRRIKTVQKKFQSEISDHIIKAKSDGNRIAPPVFLLFSYLYGLLHVIGPGHRKIFLFSYFVSSRDEWKKGMVAGFFTAVLHAVSAVIFIGGLYIITSKALLSRFNNLTPVIEKLSYGTIVLIGLYLLISNIRNFGHGHSHAGDGKKPGTILFVLASGLIPCPGAATIMIFSIAVNAPLTGIMSVLAMSLGMGTVLTFIPPAAILLQDKLDPFISRWNPATGDRIHFGLSIFGALIMILFGFIFMI